MSLFALALVSATIVVARRHDATRTGSDSPASGAGPAVDSPPPTLAAPASSSRPPRLNATPMASPHPTLRVRALANGRPAVGAKVRVMSARTRGPNPPGYGDAIAVGDGGTIEIDASPALKKQEVTGSRRIEVQGLLDDAFATTVTITVPESAADGTAFAGTINVDLSFRRAAIVVGRVLAPDGLPVLASVQALRDEDTAPEGTRAFGVGVAAGADGRFRLVVDGEDSALVVAARAGARPATVAVTLVRGRELDVGGAAHSTPTPMPRLTESSARPTSRSSSTPTARCSRWSSATAPRSSRTPT